ncbi:hypothetical protein [Psychroserpens algicola]|uniref:Uncharacterized protein n=1 Tax=Psychroserpens algicola TaxID=1719034 RepID=A0ABT0HD20_9FLAO|nr:hypothetical protein [Psychroserpens algicola]MCK8482271.1 hypothetical protein [Psychroserpens algicola]
MCKKVNYIKFCTCSDGEIINVSFADEVETWYRNKATYAFIAFEDGKYYDTYYKWTLSTLDYKAKESSVMGRMVYPKEKLNESLNKNEVLKILNSESPFDFEYTPNENDLIEIREVYEFVSLDDHPREYIENLMSFKYSNGKWVFGIHPLHYIHKEFKKGKIKS